MPDQERTEKRDSAEREETPSDRPTAPRPAVEPRPVRPQRPHGGRL